MFIRKLGKILRAGWFSEAKIMDGTNADVAGM